MYSGKDRRALNLANWFLVGIGEIYRPGAATWLYGIIARRMRLPYSGKFLRMASLQSFRGLIFVDGGS